MQLTWPLALQSAALPYSGACCNPAVPRMFPCLYLRVRRHAIVQHTHLAASLWLQLQKLCLPSPHLHTACRTSTCCASSCMPTTTKAGAACGSLHGLATAAAELPGVSLDQQTSSGSTMPMLMLCAEVRKHKPSLVHQTPGVVLSNPPGTLPHYQTVKTAAPWPAGTHTPSALRMRCRALDLQPTAHAQ